MWTRYYIVGIVALMIGLQFRAVDSFVLTQRASTFIEQKVRTSGVQTESPYASVLMTAGPVPKKTLTPPRWMGWALLSVGGVMMLHGVSSRRS